MVLSIHYLRGLAALIVVCFHFRYYLNDIFPHIEVGDMLFHNGAFGVDLFFIISGFIICYSTERQEPFPVISFALKRFFRIYPLFFVSLLGFVFLIGNQEQSLLEAFIPLHADYQEKGPFYGYHALSPVWTLVYELAFYLLFLCAMLFSTRYRKSLALLLLIALFVLLQMGQHGAVELSAYQRLGNVFSSRLEPFVAIFSSPMVLEFVFGIALFFIYQSLPVVDSQRSANIIAVLSLIVALFSVLALYHPLFQGHGPLKWGLPSFMLLLSLLVYEKQKGFPRVDFLFFLGNISFSLYLVHMIVIKLMRKYEFVVDWYGLFVFAIALMLSIACAYLIYLLVERRSVALCRHLLKTLKESRDSLPRSNPV